MKTVLFLVATFCAAFCFQIQATETKTILEETQMLTCGKCKKPACGGCHVLACSGCKSVLFVNTESQQLACGCRGKGRPKDGASLILVCECEDLETEHAAA